MSLTQTFRVKLEQDVVLSVTAATSGQHQSLDYLPGAVFLGIAAAQGYHNLDVDDAWTLFHSGAVRFHDATISASERPSFPLPLSLHAYKDETISDDNGRLIAGRLFDPTLKQGTDPLRQPRQLRTGYITDCGQHCLPLRGQRMKTAIDATTGRAAESQLFSYEALQAGQTFIFHLEAETHTEALFKRAVQWLTGSASIGRSRSAQYGRVRITPIEVPAPSPCVEETDDSSLTLWLLSDLALLNTNGQPTLAPQPHLLGLPEGTSWLCDQSYIRTRCYSPYNGKRRCHDPERKVLSRGSVLRYRLPRTLSAKERERLQSRGLYRECGLGRIAVNPVMLSAERPVFSATLKVANNPTIPAPPAPATLLASLLQRRAALAGDKIQAQEISTAIFRELCQSLDRARAWQGIPDSQALIAPGRSQWGHLKKLASDHRHRPHELWQALFQGDKAMIRTRSGWELETAPDTTLADEFQAICKRHYQHDIDDGALGEIMGHLAVRGLTQDWADAVGGNTRHDQENKE